MTPLNKMFPKGDVKFDNNEHMLKVRLGHDAFEYWQLQVFKLISSRGFTMRGSHQGPIKGYETQTFTFGR